METVLPGLPAEVIGIQGNTMPPQAGTGVERLEAIGLGFGRVYHLPYIDVHFIAQYSQFVDQSDVYIAVGIL